MLILGYHRINDGARDGLSVDTNAFRDQLIYLRDRGWKNVPPEDLLANSANGNGDGHGKKQFAITLDDGYQDNYAHAFPILQKLGMRAMVFVTTEYMDTDTLYPWVAEALKGRKATSDDLPLTWRQLHEMTSSGVFTVGSHTLTHPFLSRIAPDHARREIEESKRVLEDRLGHTVDFFCYPAGDFNENTVRMVGEAGYAAAVVSPDRYIPQTPLTLHRVNVDRETTRFLFRLKTSPLFAAMALSRPGWRARALTRRVYRRR